MNCFINRIIVFQSTFAHYLGQRSLLKNHDDGHRGTAFRNFIEFLRRKRDHAKKKTKKKGKRGNHARETREMFPFLLTGGKPEGFYRAYGSAALRTSAAI